MLFFGKKKKSLQVSLAARKKATTPLPPLAKRPKRKIFKNRKKMAFFGLLVALVILLFAFSGTLTSLAKRVVSDSPVQFKHEQTPLEKIVNEIGKQYLLPQGETPTLAMVTSLDELGGQPFFAKAQVGDAVLMYLVAKKAILWRPSTAQIIEIGPITVTKPSDVPPPTATST